MLMLNTRTFFLVDVNFSSVESISGLSHDSHLHIPFPRVPPSKPLHSPLLIPNDSPNDRSTCYSNRLVGAPAGFSQSGFVLPHNAVVMMDARKLLHIDMKTQHQSSRAFALSMH